MENKASSTVIIWCVRSRSEKRKREREVKEEKARSSRSLPSSLYFFPVAPVRRLHPRTGSRRSWCSRPLLFPLLLPVAPPASTQELDRGDLGVPDLPGLQVERNVDFDLEAVAPVVC